LSLESVELGVGEEAELESEVLSDEETTDDPDSAGLSQWGCGKCGDEGCSGTFEFLPMFGEVKGGVQFNS
jgi:hypothetical protein